MSKLIETELEKHIYSKLKYYKDDWYTKYGVDFIFNN